MLFTAVVDYIAAVQITKEKECGRRGKPWLLLSVISNLGLLAYFKYANFAVGSFTRSPGRSIINGCIAANSLRLGAARPKP